MKKNEKITLNVQHEFITLRTPWGNFTRSFGGEKITGQLIQIKGIYGRLMNEFKQFETQEKSILAGFEHLQKNFVKIVPEVLQFAEVENFKVGDVVKFNPGAFSKKYPGKYTVASVAKKYVYISTPKGNIGFEKFHLVKET